MSSRERRFAAVAAAGVLLLVVLVLAIVLGTGGPSSDGSRRSSSESTGGFQGAALPSGVQAPGFELTDQQGREVPLAGLRGQIVVLTFTYAACGAPCEVIAQQIRGALDELSRPATVLMISADPRDDTPAAIRRFLTNVSLNGRVRYLTGTKAQLERVWREYRVAPARAGRGSASSFAGAASVLLLDARGQERVEFGQEQLTAEALAHDIQKLEGDPAGP